MGTKSRFEQASEDLRRKPKAWLVTGVAGFIGSHILETLLALEQKVFGLDNFITGKKENLSQVRALVGDERWKRFTFIEGDIRNSDDCRQAVRGAEFVLHQAALGSVPRSIEDPVTSMLINVNGFVNTYLAAKEEGVRGFVYASSSSVYGDHPDLPKHEDVLGKPLSPYAVTKRTNELYADAFSSAYNLPSIGLRYFNVFGPRQDPRGQYAAVVPRWLAAMRDGTPCQINGDGSTSRDFCFVKNVVQANILSALRTETLKGSLILNVATKTQTSLNELHTTLQASIGKLNPKFKVLPPSFAPFRSGDVKHSLADISRAASEIGYAPTHSFAEGIQETASWFFANV